MSVNDRDWSVWISVKDRLPKGTAKVLVWVGVNYDGMGMYPEYRTALYHSIDKRFYVDHDTSIRGELIGEVTHWMPLPEPPKDGEAIEEEPAEMSAVEFVTTLQHLCINEFAADCKGCPLWRGSWGCGLKTLRPVTVARCVAEWTAEHEEAGENG